MMTEYPSPSAWATIFRVRAGDRCADVTVMVQGIPNPDRTRAASPITGSSDLLPMRIRTLPAIGQTSSRWSARFPMSVR